MDQNETIRLLGETLEDIGQLYKYLGKWFNKDGKLENEMSSEELIQIIQHISRSANDIQRDDARYVYALWLRQKKTDDAPKT